MNERDFAALLLDISAVTLNVQQPYRYTSGILSPIYCDNRLIISHPEQRSQVIQGFLDLLSNAKVQCDVVGGTATAGIPHAAWIADRLKLPMVYIRKEAKGHGKKNQIEGSFAPQARVVVIEDLISTGGSALDAVTAVRNAGGVVNDCCAIFTYEMATAQQGFADANVRLHTLTNFSTLVSVAAERGTITAEEQHKVLEWNQNPKEWGKTMGYES